MITSVSLDSILTHCSNGLSVRQSKEKDGLPITRIETISHESIDGTRVGYARLVAKTHAKWLLQANDILFSHINSEEHLGKVAIYTGEPAELIHGMNLLCLRFDSTLVSPRYLLHVLRSGRFRQAVRRIANRSVNQASVSITNLKKLQVPLLPLPEQKRIASILDAADDLRAKRRESIEQLDSLVQATFLEMFGDPVTNPKGWPKKNLSAIGHVKTGSTPPTKLGGMFGGEVPFVTPGDLNDTWVTAGRSVTNEGARHSRVVSAGATFVCCIGATIGKMGKAKWTSAFNQQINAVEWNPVVDPTFGFEAMRFLKHAIVSSGTSTTLPILKKSLFEKLELLTPPLDLQTRFASIVESIEEQKARLKAHLAELDTLFASLQSRAFNGELMA